MQPLPEILIETGMVLAGLIGLLILVAPTFGLKPQATVDGWRFSVKPTCLLLYYLALCAGMGAVAFGAVQLLGSSTNGWMAWVSFVFGFFLVPIVLADWPEPLILDQQGLLEPGFITTRIDWQELQHVRAYRLRCDRGVVIHGAGDKRLVVADIAYDSEAVLECLMKAHIVPYYSLKDKIGNLSILGDR